MSYQDDEAHSRRVEQLNRDAEAYRLHEQEKKEQYDKIANFDMGKSKSNSYTNTISEDYSRAPSPLKSGVIFALLAMCYRYFEYDSEVGPLFLSAMAGFIAGYVFFWQTIITVLSIVVFYFLASWSGLPGF